MANIRLHKSIIIPFMAGAFHHSFGCADVGGLFIHSGLLLNDNELLPVDCSNGLCKIKHKLNINVIKNVIKAEEVESVEIGTDGKLLMFYDAEKNRDIEEGLPINLSASIVFAQYHNMQGFYFDRYGNPQTDCPFVGKVFICHKDNVEL